MMFMKFNLKNRVSVVLFLLSVLVACGFSADDANAQRKTDSEVLITIERGACYGTCPIYSAQISGNGTVIYNGIENVKVKGKKQFKIPKTKVQELIKAFESINYFTLKDKYETDERGMRVADLPPVTTSISLKGKTKKIVHLFGAPKELKDLENKIDEAAELKKLISD
jgi:hypothetical protein